MCLVIHGIYILRFKNGYSHTSSHTNYTPPGGFIGPLFHPPLSTEIIKPARWETFYATYIDKGTMRKIPLNILPESRLTMYNGDIERWFPPQLKYLYTNKHCTWKSYLILNLPYEYNNHYSHTSY